MILKFGGWFLRLPAIFFSKCNAAFLGFGLNYERRNLDFIWKPVHIINKKRCWQKKRAGKYGFKRKKLVNKEHKGNQGSKSINPNERDIFLAKHLRLGEIIEKYKID